MYTQTNYLIIYLCLYAMFASKTLMGFDMFILQILKKIALNL